jgi:hypothetical protein
MRPANASNSATAEIISGSHFILGLVQMYRGGPGRAQPSPPRLTGAVTQEGRTGLFAIKAAGDGTAAEAKLQMLGGGAKKD